MVDVVHGLGKQHRDVLVMQLIHRSTAVAHPANQAEMAQQAKLMRHERLLETDARRKIADRARTVAETCQQTHATRRRQSLHRLGDRLGDRRINLAERHPSVSAVGHRRALA